MAGGNRMPLKYGLIPRHKRNKYPNQQGYYGLSTRKSSISFIYPRENKKPSVAVKI
jgi:hypothetical protein